MALQTLRRFPNELLRTSGAVLRINRGYASKAITIDTNDEVLFHEMNETGVIELNRSKALNSLTLNMIRKMDHRLREWEYDPLIKQYLVKGAGEKAFCAGGDVVAIYESGKSGVGNLTTAFFEEEYRLDHLTSTLSKPYVCLMNGITMGGGVGISVHGAFRVVSEKTLFAMPETAIGFLTDVGGSYFLPRLPGNLGIFLAMTGHRLSGRDLRHLGLATHFVDSSRMKNLENDLCRLANPDFGSVADLLSVYERTSRVEREKSFSLAPHMQHIDSLFAATSVKGIIAALANDASPFALETLKTLRKMSPTSLHVVHRLIREGSRLPLHECLQLEYRVAQRLLKSDDFYEGVRTKLVEKSHAPQWRPPTVEDVKEAVIELYFEQDSTLQDEILIEQPTSQATAMRAAQ